MDDVACAEELTLDFRALFLRSQDRIANGANYPNLHFPEIYVLEGGYRNFFAENKVISSPWTRFDRRMVGFLRSSTLRRDAGPCIQSRSEA